MINRLYTWHSKSRNHNIPDVTIEETSIVQSTTISNIDLRDRQPWIPNALHLAILRPQIDLLPVSNFGGSIWNKHHTVGVMRQINLVEIYYYCSWRRDEDQLKQNNWLMIKMEIIMGLPNSVFTHGQLYVGVSWVTSKDGLKILPIAGHKYLEGCTRNVV
jgi:hypothetical protein